MLPKSVKEELLKPTRVENDLLGMSVMEEEILRKQKEADEKSQQLAFELLEDKMLNHPLIDDLMHECLEEFTLEHLMEKAAKYGKVELKEKSWMTDDQWNVEINFRRTTGSSIYARGSGDTEKIALIRGIKEAHMLTDDPELKNVDIR